MQDDKRFTEGLEIRREVLENEYVDNNLAGSDEFMMTFQRIVTELNHRLDLSGREKPLGSNSAEAVFDFWTTGTAPRG